MNVTTVQEILQLLTLAIQYGAPAVEDAIAKIKAAGTQEPTLQQVNDLLTGVRPPTDYSGL